MNSINTKRQRLLTLIKKYLSQSNIKMKYPLMRYQTKLINGKSLTEKELDSMIPLLVWNMKMTREQIKDYFSEITRTQPVKREVTNTLDQFFV